MQSSFALIESNTSGTGRLFARAVRAAGLRPVLITSDPSRYPYAVEDGVETVATNTDDVAQVKDACVELDRLTGLAAVLTSSDYFVGTAAVVAAELGLPGPDPRAIQECRYKTSQHRVLAHAGVRVPETREVSTTAAASSAAARIGYPVVLKPVEGSGSVGVLRCDDGRQVTQHSIALLARTHNERGTPLPRRLLVQQHIDGPEFSVEVMFGTAVGVTGKLLGAPPWSVEIGHDYPARLPIDHAEWLSHTAETACKELGLDWGAAHVELRFTSDGPYVIEVNPRLAGGYIPRLVQLAERRDLVTELVSAAAGRQHRESICTSTPKTAASIRFLLAHRCGRFLDIAGLQQVSQIPGVAEVAIYPASGAPVEKRGDFRDRLGHVLTHDASSAVAIALADQMISRLAVLIGDDDDYEY